MSQIQLNLKSGLNNRLIVRFADPLKNVKKVKVLSVEVPFSYYVVNSANNTFNFSELSTEKTAMIPEGNYTTAQFTSALKLAMDTAGTNVYTVVLNENTSKLLISANAGFTLNVNNGTSTKNIRTYRLLGFDATLHNEIVSVAGEAITSDYVINLSGDDALYLRSQRFARYGSSYLGEYSRNIIFKIPVNTNPFSVIYYQNTERDNYILNQGDINTIDFEIVNFNEEIINFNGEQFTINLLLYTN